MRPEPTSPPMPTTSPACTCRLHAAHGREPRAGLAPRAARRRCRTGRSGIELLDLAADHELDQLVRSASSAGRPVAVVRPSASTVTRSPMRRISSRRWEM